MKKNYFKHAALAMGIVAVAGSANAEWVNVNNQYVKQPSFVPGWSGALTDVANGVGECFNGAFEVYQVLDLPAGKYTLKANAFQRLGDPMTAYKAFKADPKTTSYIYINDVKTAVPNIFSVDGVSDETVKVDGDNNIEWDVYPVANDTKKASEEFAAGKYAVSAVVEHKGGALRFGIVNTGSRVDEWACFDNFTLEGPSGAIKVENGDFSEGFPAYTKKNPVYGSWDLNQSKNDPKAPDINKGGGVYRKTNASPYNFGQEVDLPAGKYRVGIQSFLRYGGAGNVAGKYVTCKGAWGWVEDESALDRYNNKTEAEADNAYVYATNGWDTYTNDIYGDNKDAKKKPILKEDALDSKTGNPDGFYNETRIKSMFDEKLDVYPDNEPSTDGTTAEGYSWCDSGFEYQAAACFIKNPDLYRNYVEFELTEPSKVWIGWKKDVNAPTQWWNPFRDFTLEKYVAEGGSAVSEVEVADENAPVEYYNLQGVRVANPTNGLYIVKQGKKVTKQIFK